MRPAVSVSLVFVTLAFQSHLAYRVWHRAARTDVSTEKHASPLVLEEKTVIPKLVEREERDDIMEDPNNVFGCRENAYVLAEVSDEEFHAGAQGKVYKVSKLSEAHEEEKTFWAMKVDTKTDNAYHTDLNASEQTQRLWGESMAPECGILKYLQDANVPLVPRCIDECNLKGHRAFVMTLVSGAEKIDEAFLTKEKYATLSPRGKAAFVIDSLKHMLHLVKAKVSPVDVEAVLDDDPVSRGWPKLAMLDWGGAQYFDYETGEYNIFLSFVGLPYIMQQVSKEELGDDNGGLWLMVVTAFETPEIQEGHDEWVLGTVATTLSNAYDLAQMAFG